jgi:tetratricopeptide (TPR) repeat protein
MAHLMPCAVLLPDGVMLAHGALPRPARLQDLRDAEQLALSDAALRDFTLGRLHPREPVVNAGEREGGVIEGFEDFHASRRALSALLGAPVQRLVRGQDAAPEGYRWFRAYGEGRLLTLTTMADALPEAAGGGRRHPCVGRLKGGRIRVARIELPDEITFLGDQLFPRELAQPKPTEVAEPSQPAEPVQSLMVVEEIRITAIELPTEAPMAKPAPSVLGSAEPMDPAASLRSDPRAAAMHFDRGVRLLQARAWTGARDAFREAAEVPSFRDAAALNEAVACLWLGNAGHQEALARLRELRQREPRSAAVHFNLGVAFLSGERNPSEAMRSLRAAVDAAPDMTDAWWALGLAAAMRSDASTAASAFARAADGGCVLPAPGSLHGVIPAREMAPALEALRGLARFCPTADGPPVSLAD